MSYFSFLFPITSHYSFLLPFIFYYFPLLHCYFIFLLASFFLIIVIYLSFLFIVIVNFICTLLKLRTGRFGPDYRCWLSSDRIKSSHILLNSSRRDASNGELASYLLVLET
ncbi:hypothetical protein GLOIN_2v1587478 [Rhizophagus irregularis DAOM 181602=DAOM 197198]|nr:hypothetical protein GLOIN_2v1587478 [Rhizophagus irregularis DAOM 181602=DAOM 197198]